ncbi:hypothetical protein AWN76_007330 [Rhodothermaceae bacterium RA]|nr:hypothetical protein AWN76_007330 [Rhodothermaceae bacterium RA]
MAASRPTFLIIGAAKAGTTSLYRYLAQHPQVFMSDPKEPRFFAYEGGLPAFGGPGDHHAHRHTATTWEAYTALFAAASAPARGEASPIYLYSPEAPARIRHYLPDAHLIAILRNPADRAYSHYMHMRKDGREPLRDFRQALAAEPQRIADGWEWSWHYARVGFYHQQLRRYLQFIDRSRLSIYLFEDLQQDPLGTVRSIFERIGVDAGFEPDVSQRYNPTGIPRSRRLQRLIQTPDHPLRRLSRRILPESVRDRWLNAVKHRNLDKPPLAPEVRADLVQRYREDLLRLQDLLDRDLSAWLTV